MKKTAVTTLYIFGAAIVVLLAGVFLSHSGYVPFPDAMLQFTLYELAAIWLAIGALPMLAACFLMRRVYGTRGGKTALLFLPGALCAAALLFWLGVLGLMTVSAFLPE